MAPKGIQRGSRRVTIRLLTALVAIIAGVPAVHAQECPELPVVPEPELRSCTGARALDPTCRAENNRRTREWQEQMRRFSTPISVAGDAQESSTTLEYAIGGCRGSIINVDLNATRVSWIRYELIAPSGTTVSSEQLTPRHGSALGAAIRLPESGFYRLRLTATTTAERRTRCKKYEGSVLKAKCVAEEVYTAYPLDFVLSFRGNVDAAALRIGERADGTVTRQQPLSRRVTVDAGEPARARVVSTGASVICQAEAPDGTALPVSASGDGCQIDLPEARRDATYVIAVTANTGNPAGVSIFVEALHSSSLALHVGQQAEGLLALPAQANAPSQAEWTLDIARQGPHSLTIVPSGLARLEVEATLYHRTTEEVLINRQKVSARRTFNVVFPVAGSYVLRLTPVSYDRQAAQAGARYTLLLDR